MAQNRPVPQINYQRSQFPMMPPGTPPSQAWTTIPPNAQQLAIGDMASDIEQLQELALEIYARLAVDGIIEGRQDFTRLAAEAQKAARAYYESLGIQFPDSE